MKPIGLRHTLGACFIGAALANGCAHQDKAVAQQSKDLLPPVSAMGQKDQKSQTTAVAAAKPDTDSKVVPATYTTFDKSTVVQAKAETPAAVLPPVVYADAPAASPTKDSQLTVPKVDVAADKKECVSKETTRCQPIIPDLIKKSETVAVVTEPAKKIESAPATKLVDGTPGHAADYTWLCGQVQYSRLSKGWRLRYAGVEETDAYGGSVTLVDDGRLANLKDGDVVRVQGHLENVSERSIAPHYVIHSVEVQAH